MVFTAITRIQIRIYRGTILCSSVCHRLDNIILNLIKTLLYWGMLIKILHSKCFGKRLWIQDPKFNKIFKEISFKTKITQQKYRTLKTSIFLKNSFLGITSWIQEEAGNKCILSRLVKNIVYWLNGIRESCLR